jgi:hypothetical protein
MIELHDLREVPTGQATAWLGAIATDLRLGDREEIDATTDMSPEDALVGSAAGSDMAWIISNQGRPMTVFGCAPSAPGSGQVWMMGTPEMDAVSLRLGRVSLRCLHLMHAKHACLWNYIDARNEQSMRWLRWTGFQLLEAHPQFGRQGRLFFTFARYDPNVSSRSRHGGARRRQHGGLGIH